MLENIANGILFVSFILSMSMSLFFITQLNSRFVSIRMRQIIEFIFASSFVYIIMILTFYTLGFIFFIYMPVMIALVSTINRRTCTGLSFVTPIILAFSLLYYRGWEISSVIQLMIVLCIVINVICWLTRKINTINWKIFFVTTAFMLLELVELRAFIPSETTVQNVTVICLVYITFGVYIAALTHYTERNALFQDEVMYTDELTDIQNYRALNEFMVGPDNNEHVIMMVFDIDRFKAINDLNGHVVGNEVLKMVVRSLHEVLLTQSQIDRFKTFRFGGDEIVVALWLKREAAMDVACIKEQFALLRTKIHEKGQESFHLNVTISAGASDNLFYQGNLNKTFIAADQALYDMKFAEKNGVAFDQHAINTDGK